MLKKLSLLILALTATAFADNSAITHSTSQNPPQAVIRFEKREIKSLKDENLNYRKLPLDEIFNRNPEIYDENIADIKVVHSSNPQNMIRTNIAAGLLGSMLEAYSSHIPLVIRPDDVWLSITSAFARYVTNHPELMRKLLVKHDGKKQLVVYMAGSLSISDERFWGEFTKEMLKLVGENTPKELSKWLVPNFSTTTVRDRLVGQIVMMGALKEYFDYRGVFSCALTKLTLKGTLEDWKNVRARAAKLAQYGPDMSRWTELLLPVLDQFIATYQGKVDESFWQRMVTFRPLGSGGQKDLRGWFLVFSPFKENGEYYLNSKEEILKTGIYATVRDDDIPVSTVAVPVSLNDNGKEHLLSFWGGVSRASYDKTNNEIAPSVDWAIIDIQPKSADALRSKLTQYFSKYEELPPKHQKLITPEEFARGVEEHKRERAEEEKKWKAEEDARDEAIAKTPKPEFFDKLLQRHGYSTYEKLPEIFKPLLTKEEFAAAKAARDARWAKETTERNEKQIAEYKAEHERLLKLPKSELLEYLASHEYYKQYKELDADFKKLITKEEFDAAADPIKKRKQEEYKNERGWQ